MLKRWNAYVWREGRSRYIGEVGEHDEALARCLGV